MRQSQQKNFFVSVSASSPCAQSCKQVLYSYAGDFGVFLLALCLSKSEIVHVVMYGL